VGCSPDGVKPFSPYGTLITHGMVLDQEGKKMSKSLGNIISPMTVINGGKDQKKEPAYGTDGLRLWAASVDYWNDMSIGPTVLKQVDQALKKIRYSARFILGNIGDAHNREAFVPVPREQLGLAERYVMSELYDVEQAALDGYNSYNFPKVVNAITRFTNVTLSSLYFDIMKDCLYANAVQSHERRAVVTVLQKILETMSSIIAPITPYLAEEIHDALNGGTDKSVFSKPWLPLGSEWKDPSASSDMATLLRVREEVLLLLEKARAQKLIGSSLEADVDLILPSDLSNTDPILSLLRREG
jgi:isoleucyl-tRNA synthetase